MPRRAVPCYATLDGKTWFADCTGLPFAHLPISSETRDVLSKPAVEQVERVFLCCRPYVLPVLLHGQHDLCVTKECRQGTRA